MDESSCTVEDCERKPFRRNRCKRHYSEALHSGAIPRLLNFTPGDPCAVDGCPRLSVIRGWCAKHYARWKRHGDVHFEKYPADRVKVCPSCGDTARPRAGKQSLHCAPCWNRIRRERRAAEYLRAPDNCIECGGVIGRRIAGKVFCSNTCKYRDQNRTRKARIRASSPVGRIPGELLAGKWAYWGGRCWMCGEPADCWDHVKPLAAGGTHILANLRPACVHCNSSKGARWPYPLAR